MDSLTLEQAYYIGELVGAVVIIFSLNFIIHWQHQQIMTSLKPFSQSRYLADLLLR